MTAPTTSPTQNQPPVMATQIAKPDTFFDQCHKLATEAIGRFDKRREYEWKVSLGFWLVLLMLNHKDYRIPHVPGWGFVVAGFVFVGVWVRGIHVANKMDKERYELYRKYMVQFLRDGKASLEDDPKRISWCECRWWFSFLGDWSAIFQALITVGLLWIAYLSSTSATTDSKADNPAQNPQPATQVMRTT